MKAGYIEEIKYLFNPSSIAVVGASNNPSKPGGLLINYLTSNGYQGEVFPIHPNEKEVKGYKAYSKLMDVPQDIDLVCLIVSWEYILGYLKDCANKGVKAVAIFASGFAEVGDEGVKRQGEIVNFSKKGGFRVCGPNSIGIFNVKDEIYPAFSRVMDSKIIPKGSISFITQSGALGGSLLSRAWEQGIGFTRCVSSGNEADLTTVDYVEYLVEDPYTKCICLLLEGVSNGRKFKKVATKALEAKKPIVVFKSGRTPVGASSVQSHTGALAGSDEVFQAFCKQYGLLRVKELEDLFDIGKALSSEPLPKSNSVGIISTSGGACSIAADSCIDNGLEVRQLSVYTKTKLAEVIPSFGSSQNPVDVTAQVLVNIKLFTESLIIIASDENIDSLVVVLTTIPEPLATELAKGIVEVKQVINKPLVVAWTIAPSLAPGGITHLIKNDVSLYPTPEKAIRAISMLYKYKCKLAGICTNTEDIIAT